MGQNNSSRMGGVSVIYIYVYHAIEEQLVKRNVFYPACRSSDPAPPVKFCFCNGRHTYGCCMCCSWQSSSHWGKDDFGHHQCYSCFSTGLVVWEYTIGKSMWNSFIYQLIQWAQVQFGPMSHVQIFSHCSTSVLHFWHCPVPAKRAGQGRWMRHGCLWAQI